QSRISHRPSLSLTAAGGKKILRHRHSLSLSLVHLRYVHATVRAGDTPTEVTRNGHPHHPRQHHRNHRPPRHHSRRWGPLHHPPRHRRPLRHHHPRCRRPDHRRLLAARHRGRHQPHPRTPR